MTATVGTGVAVYKWWKGRKKVRNHFAPAFVPFGGPSLYTGNEISFI